MKNSEDVCGAGGSVVSVRVAVGRFVGTVEVVAAVDGISLSAAAAVGSIVVAAAAESTA